MVVGNFQTSMRRHIFFLVKVIFIVFRQTGSSYRTRQLDATPLIYNIDTCVWMLQTCFAYMPLAIFQLSRTVEDPSVELTFISGSMGITATKFMRKNQARCVKLTFSISFVNMTKTHTCNTRRLVLLYCEFWHWAIAECFKLYLFIAKVTATSNLFHELMSH